MYNKQHDVPCSFKGGQMNKLQKLLEYIVRYKSCTSLDIQLYCNTTDPRKFINILTHRGIIDNNPQWCKSRSGAKYKTYYLANINVKDIDMVKCVLNA